MLRIISFTFCSLLFVSLFALPATAQEKKMPVPQPYISKKFPPSDLLAPLCKQKPEQILGKIQIGENRYTVYIAVMGRGTVNAHPATLEKLDTDGWILSCMGTMPQVVLTTK